jgi:cytochrome c peroxidase
MKTRVLSLIIVSSLFLLSSCIHDRVDVEVKYYTDEEYEVLKTALNLPANLHEYNFTMPTGGFVPGISNSKATLGRVLFYDTKLSRTNSVSCASCHKQELAFSDDKARSIGFDGGETKRNSLALASVANFETSYGGGNSFVGFNTRLGFLWDERAQSIHELSQIAITDPIEMGMNMAELPSKLSQNAHYSILFRKAYGDPNITPNRITEAIQEFVNSFVSVNSKFDKGAFTALENLGRSLFMVNCATCHSTDMTNPVMRVANNGLALDYADKGVGGITNKPGDMDLFKVPFLRNIALTAPYMHDGRFATLEEVVEHYNSGIQMHPNLHNFLKHPLQPNQPKRLNLSSQEKAALVAFLRTLTDETFIAEVKFSDPFK